MKKLFVIFLGSCLFISWLSVLIQSCFFFRDITLEKKAKINNRLVVKGFVRSSPHRCEGNERARDVRLPRTESWRWRRMLLAGRPFIAMMDAWQALLARSLFRSLSTARQAVIMSNGFTSAAMEAWMLWQHERSTAFPSYPCTLSCFSTFTTPPVMDLPKKQSSRMRLHWTIAGILQK